MKQQNKFKSEQQQEHVTQQQQTTQNAAQEFATVDELLRFDASQTSPPGTLQQRLQKSSADIPKPPSPSWWQRLFK